MFSFPIVIKFPTINQPNSFWLAESWTCLQTLANNSTGNAIQEIIWYLAIIRGWIPCQIGVSYSSIRVCTSQIGFYTNQYLYKHVGIQVTLNRARILVNKILGYQYQALTQLRLQSFEIRLEDQSRIRTPICRNLLVWYSSPHCVKFFLLIFCQGNDKVY